MLNVDIVHVDIVHVDIVHVFDGPNHMSNLCDTKIKSVSKCAVCLCVCVGVCARAAMEDAAVPLLSRSRGFRWTIDKLLSASGVTHSEDVDPHYGIRLDQCQQLIGDLYTRWRWDGGTGDMVRHLFLRFGIEMNDQVDWDTVQQALRREQYRLHRLRRVLAHLGITSGETVDRLNETSRIIYSAPAMLRSLQTMRMRADPRGAIPLPNQTTSPDLETGASPPTDGENMQLMSNDKNNAWQNMFFRLCEVLGGTGYRRADGKFFKRRVTRSGFQTLAFEEAITIEAFVSVHLNHHLDLQAFRWGTSGNSNIHHAIEYLTKRALPEAPDLVEDCRYRSYEGDLQGRGAGIYDCQEDFFWPYDQVERWGTMAKEVERHRRLLNPSYTLSPPKEDTVCVVHLDCVWPYDTLQEMYTWTTRDYDYLWREADHYECEDASLEVTSESLGAALHEALPHGGLPTAPIWGQSWMRCKNPHWITASPAWTALGGRSAKLCWEVASDRNSVSVQTLSAAMCKDSYVRDESGRKWMPLLTDVGPNAVWGRQWTPMPTRKEVPAWWREVTSDSHAKLHHAVVSQPDRVPPDLAKAVQQTWFVRRNDDVCLCPLRSHCGRWGLVWAVVHDLKWDCLNAEPRCTRLCAAVVANPDLVGWEDLLSPLEECHVRVGDAVLRPRKDASGLLGGRWTVGEAVGVCLEDTHQSLQECIFGDDGALFAAMQVPLELLTDVTETTYALQFGTDDVWIPLQTPGQRPFVEVVVPPECTVNHTSFVAHLVDGGTRWVEVGRKPPTGVPLHHPRLATRLTASTHPLSAEEWAAMEISDLQRCHHVFDGKRYFQPLVRYFRPYTGRTWRDCEVNEIDQIYECQKFTIHDCFFCYALKGRLFFEVGELDNHEMCLFYEGVGGCGKSTIMKAQQCFWPGHLQGILSPNVQPQFGMSAVARDGRSRVIFCNEINENLQIVQEEWQTSVSGEMGSYSVKHQQAPLVLKWIAQHMWVGNGFPERWRNLQGQVSRRIAGVMMQYAVKKRDGGILSRIRGKFGALQRKEILAYHEFRRVTGRIDPMSEPAKLPPAFSLYHTESLGRSNQILGFLKETGWVKVVDGGIALLDAFKKAFQAWQRENDMPKAVWKPALYASAFQEHGFQVSFQGRVVLNGVTYENQRVITGVEVLKEQ
jgi:hypothetical protein